MFTDAIDLLALFKDFSPEQLALLRPLFTAQSEAAGAQIFNQGDPAVFLYLVTEGEVIIRYKPEDGPIITVARIQSEGIVGWSAALGNPAYTSAAECITNCQFLRVRGQDLRDLCEKHPDTGNLVRERLAAQVAERVSNTHQHVIALLEHGLHRNGESPEEAD
ncbi:MAG: cyclic nucleotide-binding domain-containing protein [Anaerolineales bacterium]|nr:cyclic nucleotide-binding domain-containing protein [Anaerolineales bacterium]